MQVAGEQEFHSGGEVRGERSGRRGQREEVRGERSGRRGQRSAPPTTGSELAGGDAMERGHSCPRIFGRQECRPSMKTEENGIKGLI
jgi:hypothetical protein